MPILNHPKDNGAETAPDVSQRTDMHHVGNKAHPSSTGVRR